MHLVIGAGGFTGSHAAAAVARHAEVRTVEPWDDDMAGAMAGVEFVHLAAQLRSPFEIPRGRGPHPFLILIVDLACRAGVRRLVYLSSASVLGSSHDVRVSERTRPNPEHAYERALAADETWLRERDAPEVVVLRPAQGFGPGEPVSSRLIERLRGGSLPLPGGGTAPRTFLAGADLGRAFHAAAVRGQPGMAYLLGGVRGCWRELVWTAAEALRITPRLASSSYDAAYLAAAARLPRSGLSRECWPTPFLVDLLARPQVVDDGWSRRELGWQPEVTSFAAGLTGLTGRPAPAPDAEMVTARRVRTLT